VAGAVEIRIGMLFGGLVLDIGKTIRLDGLLRGGVSPAGTKIKRGEAGGLAAAVVRLDGSLQVTEDGAGVGDKSGVIAVIDGVGGRTLVKLGSRSVASIRRS